MKKIILSLSDFKNKSILNIQKIKGGERIGTAKTKAKVD